MNIACPECSTIYRVDPNRVPGGGVTARCMECDTPLRVDPDAGPTAPGEAITAERAAMAAPEPAGAEPAVEPEPAPEAFEPAPEGPEAAPEPEAGVTATPEPAPEGAGVQSAEAEPHVEAEPSADEVEAPEGVEAPEAATPGAAAPAFGPQDPDTRARRLARALVSDIKVYHPEKWEESAEKGTLRSDFREEILKSWEEYVEQVGEEMAKETPYFRDALNEILAQGDRVF